MKKILITMIAAVLLCCCVVCGTYAWLVAESATVTNVFTVGDINITLSESENLDLKMMPGKKITKDPFITVVKNSESCWLFVKIERGVNVNTYLTFGIADGWTMLDGQTDVYYREVAQNQQDQNFKILADDAVLVNEEITKDQLQAVASDGSRLRISFKAYAVQREGIDSAAAAWDKVSSTKT